MSTLSVPTSERQPAARPTTWGNFVFWIGVVFLLLLVGLASFVLIGWLGEGTFTDADAARIVERQKILQDITTADGKYLHDQPGWFKKDAGLVRVPIDEAMKLTLADFQKAAKPHPAYPIAQAPPQNSAAPTSPDKGVSPAAPVAGKTNDINPPASNPTVGLSAHTPTASPATPITAATPASSPAASPAASATPTPSPAASPAAPVTAPTPGPQPQPSAPPAATNTIGALPSATPTAPAGAQPAPVTAPPAQPTPEATASPAATPTPNPQAPGVTPAGTP